MPLTLAPTEEMPEPQKKHLGKIQGELLKATWLVRNLHGTPTFTFAGKSFTPPNPSHSSSLITDRTESHDAGAGALLPRATPPIVATAGLVDTSSATEGPIGLVFTQTDPTLALTENPTDARTNYKIRAIQYARAAIDYLKTEKDLCLEKLNESPSLDQAKKNQALIDKINQSILKIETKIDNFIKILDRNSGEKLSTDFNTFFISLAKEMESALGVPYKKAEKKLRLAEQLLTWKEGRPSITTVSYITIYDADGKGGTQYEITQEETPITKLTKAQEKEYINTVKPGAETPPWFKNLDKSLQNYISKHVVTKTKTSNDYKVNIEAIPASLRLIPGLANFVRIKTTIKTRAGAGAETTTISIEHTQYRSATPVPIDVKGSEERIRITALNLGQLIEQKLSDKLDDELNNRLRIAFKLENLEKTRAALNNPTINEGLDARSFSTLELALSAAQPEKIKAVNAIERARIGKNYKFPVNLNSLLTEIWGAGLYPSKDNNSLLLKEIKAGLAKLKKENPIYDELDLSINNISINSLRWLFLAINKDNYADDKIYLAYCQANLTPAAYTALENLEEIKTAERVATLELGDEKKRRIFEAGKALKALQYKSDYFGDLNLMRAALRSIIIEGDDSACKSGKDRAGILTIYVTALLAYYAKYEKFPDLNLPKKLGLFFSSIRYLGFISMAFAVTSIIAFLEFGGILIMPLPAIIALAAVGLALVLVGTIKRRIDLRSISSTNLNKHRDFLQIVRHLFFTGFVQKSASLNAPGAEGVQDPDILPDALTSSVLAERPLGKLADKPFRKANLILSLVLAGALATGAHFILIAYTVTVSASVALALNWLVPAVPIALVAAYLIIKLMETAAIPSLKSPKDENEIKARKDKDEIKARKDKDEIKARKDKDEIKARNKFKKEKTVDGKLAKTNKPLGQRPSLKKAVTPFLILAITLTVAIVLLHTFVAPIPVVAAILSIEAFNAICSVGAITLFVAALLLYLKVYVPRAADAQVRALEKLGSSVAVMGSSESAGTGEAITGGVTVLPPGIIFVREKRKENGDESVVDNPAAARTPRTPPGG